MPTLRRLSCCALVFLLTLGCAGGQREAYAPQPEAERSKITIDNQTLTTMNVFIVYNGQNYRVGQVFGGQTVTERIPRFVKPTGAIQALADPVGGGSRFLSQEVSYLGTEDFRLTLRQNLQLSTFVPVRGR